MLFITKKKIFFKEIVRFHDNAWKLDIFEKLDFFKEIKLKIKIIKTYRKNRDNFFLSRNLKIIYRSFIDFFRIFMSDNIKEKEKNRIDF